MKTLNDQGKESTASSKNKKLINITIFLLGNDCILSSSSILLDHITVFFLNVHLRIMCFPAFPISLFYMGFDPGVQ